MFSTASVSFLATLAGLAVLLSGPVKQFAVDRPNARSLHQMPVPRSGGVAVTLGIGAGVAFTGFGPSLLLASATALAILSLADDLADLPALLRLVAQVLAAAVVVREVAPIADTRTLAALMVAIVWSTNLFNFMDGSDGLAGGMTVIGFGTYAIAAAFAGGEGTAALCVAIASAAFAFLLFNFHPARIFLGDVGSIPLGFLACAIGIAGWSAGLWEPWFPLLVFSPFAVDATVTLARRVWRTEKVWQAHRDHYYQRLVRMGVGHRNTALLEYALMSACACVALAAHRSAPDVQWAALAACAVAYLALMLWIDARWAKHQKSRPA